MTYSNAMFSEIIAIIDSFSFLKRKNGLEVEKQNILSGKLIRWEKPGDLSGIDLRGLFDTFNNPTFIFWIHKGKFPKKCSLEEWIDSLSEEEQSEVLFHLNIFNQEIK